MKITANPRWALKSQDLGPISLSGGHGVCSTQKLPNPVAEVTYVEDGAPLKGGLLTTWGNGMAFAQVKHTERSQGVILPGTIGPKTP